MTGRSVGKETGGDACAPNSTDLVLAHAAHEIGQFREMAADSPGARALAAPIDDAGIKNAAHADSMGAATPRFKRRAARP